MAASRTAAVCFAVGFALFNTAGRPCTAASFVIGVFDSTRATTTNIVSGELTEDARAAVTSQFPGASFAATPTLTPAFLNGVDLAILTATDSGSTGITPLSASEQSALYNYVLDGGNAILVLDGFGSFLPASQSFAAPFGIDVQFLGSTAVYFGFPTLPEHPILQGPHGEVPLLPVYGTGVFEDLGPYATSVSEFPYFEEQQSVMAVIEAGAIAPGSGRVVLIADGSAFVDTEDGGFFEYGEPLMLNAIHHLSPVPEPQSLALAAFGGGALVALAASRRSKRRTEVARES